MSWNGALIRGTAITIVLVIGVVWLPAKVLEVSFLADAPDAVRDLVASAIWAGALFGGIWGLWALQRTGRI